MGTPASSEVLKKVSVGTTYDSNAYGSHAGDADYVSQLDLYLGYRKGGERSETEFYYSGNGNLFAQSGARNFAANSLGVVYARRLGEGRSGFSVGGAVSLRKNREAYDIYDYAGAQAAANVKYYIDSTVLVRSSYRVRWRGYWNYDLGSYTEHYLSAQVNKFLATKTTLRGDLSYGYKDHQAPQTVSTGYSGSRRGETSPRSLVVDPRVPDEGQLVAGLQIAQSLAEKTGLRVRYQVRSNTTTGVDAPPVGQSVYLDDDEIFNDRYDYEGSEWTARLTQLLPWQLTLVFEAGHESREYDGREALDLAGTASDAGARRSDQTGFAAASVEKAFAPGVSVSLWYGFDRNRSNDEYYDYGGRHAVSAGLNLAF